MSGVCAVVCAAPTAGGDREALPGQLEQLSRHRVQHMEDLG